MKRLYLFLPAGVLSFILLLLATCSGSFTADAATASASTGGVTGISTGQYINASTVITGWAQSDSSFGGVQVSVDGNTLGTATVQDDASKNTQQFSSTAKSFTYTLGAAVNNLPAGAHTVQVTVNWGSGPAVYKWTAVKAAPAGGVTGISTGQYINASTVITGWAQGDSSFGGVQVSVDGNTLGTAAVQDDPGRNTQPYASTAKSFTYTLGAAANNLSVGTHTVQVTVNWGSGPVVYKWTATRAGSAGGVTGISTGQYVNASTVITGWAQSDLSFNGVQVSIDGKAVGTAAVQDDPGRNTQPYASNAKAFSFTLGAAADNLSVGAHTVQVTADWGSGSDVYKWTAVKEGSAGGVTGISTGQYINASTVITGWTQSDSSFNGVQVSADGSALGTAAVRDDAGRNMQQFSSTAKAFTYTLGAAADGLSVGTHTVQVTVNWGSGPDVYKWTAVKAAPAGGVTGISTGQYLNASTVITGWTQGDSSLNGIQVLIDGNVLGTAAVQDDPGRNTQQFSSTAKAFTYTLGDAVNNLPVGAHTIQVTINWGSGPIVYKWTAIRAGSAGGVTGISTGQYLNASTVITGWAQGDSSFGGIQISIDGNALGTATVRDDPARNTQQFSSTAKSFSYTLGAAADNLSVGAHTVQVTANWGSGSDVYKWTSIKASSAGGVTGISTGQYINTFTVITGWTQSDSSFGGIQVLIDGQMIGTATVQDDASKNTQMFSSNAKAFSYTLGSATDNLSVGAHTVQVTVNWGSGPAVYGWTAYKNIAPVSMNANWVSSSFNISLQQLAGDCGVSSTSLDPLTLAGNSTDVYQFMRLTWVDGFTADEMNSVLQADDQARLQAGYHTSVSDILLGHGADILTACQANNINPLYFVSHMILESGHGTSTLASGVNVNGVLYYNLFGIHAYDSNPVYDGSQYAAQQGWSSVQAAITGAANWISYHYVNAYVEQGVYSQNTLYEMRWDPTGCIQHGKPFAYATSTTWAHGIANLMYQYSSYLTGSSATFDLPLLSGN